MHQDIAATENTYQGFVRSVITKGQVWGLATNQGFLNTSSREFEDSKVVLFWESEELSQATALEAGGGLKPKAVSLAEFLENWLIGMYNEGFLIGINWRVSSFGAEVEPLDLALEIANQLIAAGKTQSLTKYKDIQDYQAQVKAALEAA